MPRQGIKEMRKWKEEIKRVILANCNIQFLKACLDCGFTPPTMRVKIQMIRMEKIAKECEKRVIKEVIRRNYKIIGMQIKKANEWTKGNKETEEEWRNLCKESFRITRENKQKEHKKKWEGWKKKYGLKSRETYNMEYVEEAKIILDKRNKEALNNVVDRTKRGLNDREFRLLNLGANFNQRRNNLSKKEKKDIILESENIMFKLNQKDREEVRREISKIVTEKSEKQESKEDKRFKEVRESLGKDEIIVIKADKGGKMVAIDEKDYIQKVDEHLKLEMYVKLDRFGNKEIKKFENKAQRIIRKYKKKFDSFEYRQVYPTAKRRTAILTGRIKIHKENEVIRPVINTRESTTSGLAKWLARVIRRRIPERKTSFKTTEEWKEMARTTEVKENEELAIYDIDSMFLEVDKEEAMNEIKKHLKEENEEGKLKIGKKEWEVDEICELMKLCMEENWFKWRDSFFKQKRGLFMGSSLSPILAEVVARKKEDIVLEEMKQEGEEASMFGRYVDDMVLKGSTKCIEDFGRIWNEKEGFKIKLERKGTEVKYLDTVAKIVGDKIETEWLYNQYGTGHVIDYKSNHSYNVKKGTYWGGLDRVVKACTNIEGVEKGFKKWNELYERSGYKKEIIEGWKKEWKKRREETEERKMNKEDIKYLGCFNNGAATNKLKKVFKGKGSIAIRYDKSIYNTYKGNQHTKQSDGIGVYEIKCNECEKKYIGETGRALEVRIKEHQEDVRNKNDKNAMYRHKKDEQHEMNWDSAQIIDKEEHFHKRRVLESVYIAKTKKNDEYMNGNIGKDISEEVKALLEENTNGSWDRNVSVRRKCKKNGNLGNIVETSVVSSEVELN
jgi:hypothetical protein